MYMKNTIGVCFLVYIWGLLDFSFLWVVIFAIGFMVREFMVREFMVREFMVRERDKLNRKVATENAKMILEEGKEAYLKVL